MYIYIHIQESSRDDNDDDDDVFERDTVSTKSVRRNRLCIKDDDDGVEEFTTIPSTALPALPQSLPLSPSLPPSLPLSTVKEPSSLPLSTVKEPSSLPSLSLSNIKESSLPSSLPSSSSIVNNNNIHDNIPITKSTDVSTCIINTNKNPDNKLTLTGTLNNESAFDSTSFKTLNDKLHENIDVYNLENIHNNGSEDMKDAHENINNKHNIDICNASVDNFSCVIINTKTSTEKKSISDEKIPVFKENIPILNEIVPNSDKKLTNFDDKIPNTENNNDNNNTKNKMKSNSKHNDKHDNNRRYNDEKGTRIFGFIEKINEKRERENNDSRTGSNKKMAINSDFFEDGSKQFDTSCSDLSKSGTEIRVSDMDKGCTGARVTTDLNHDRVLIKGLESMSQKRKHSEIDKDDNINAKCNTTQNKLINSDLNSDDNVDCIEKNKNKTENDENNDNNSESFTDTENYEKIDNFREEIEEKVEVLKDDYNDTNFSFTSSNLLKIIKIKKSPESKDQNIGIKEIKNTSNYFYTLSDDNQTKVIANIIKNRKHNPNMKRITPTFLVPLSMREKYLELLYFTNNIN
jgi:hypothetical protein